jgi:hypothetical protein
MKARMNNHDSGFGSVGSTCVSMQPDLLKILGVSDNNKCTKARAIELNHKLARFFHCNVIPFNVVESDELANVVSVVPCVLQSRATMTFLDGDIRC